MPSVTGLQREGLHGATRGQTRKRMDQFMNWGVDMPDHNHANQHRDEVTPSPPHPTDVQTTGGPRAATAGRARHGVNNTVNHDRSRPLHGLPARMDGERSGSGSRMRFPPHPRIPAGSHPIAGGVLTADNSRVSGIPTTLGTPPVTHRPDSTGSPVSAISISWASRRIPGIRSANGAPS